MLAVRGRKLAIVSGFFRKAQTMGECLCCYEFTKMIKEFRDSNKQMISKGMSTETGETQIALDGHKNHTWEHDGICKHPSHRLGSFHL